MINDFPSLFWPIVITSITILGIIGCLLLLIITGRKKTAVDDNPTVHVWDETITEENNPLPKWWVNLFIITIMFSLIYLYLFPGLVITDGSLNWSQESQYQKEIELADEKYRNLFRGYGALSESDFMKNRKAMKIGKKLFINQCSECHGIDGRGFIGFPNLSDNDWIYGGDIQTIRQTIKNGRNGIMPSFKNVLSAQDVGHIAHYVQYLSGNDHRPMLASFGEAKFARNCSACHGGDAKGNQMIGAPNLTDNIWLHGKGIEIIAGHIINGISNHMPSRSTRLNNDEINIVSMYVWSLSRPSE